MKICISAYIIAISGIMLVGCQKSKEIDEQHYTWSTEEPVTIPFRTRFQRYEKGNLVRNFSFETGKIFRIDSINSSFSIDGWQQIGEHVQWVDIHDDSLYKTDEVYNGIRAVKIIRKVAHETDEQGAGIQSDFIRIIPGNYNLSFCARLENVFPKNPRLGTKMFDGVDIRLLFFDRNKNQISAAYNYPLENQSIDISFKALSFANYSYIRSAGWCRVTGKSHHFPFPEGDIPSDAQFVKIFIGLKGSGTLWIDNISFSYSDRNFTVAERMQKYTDTSFITPDVLIPTPKKVRKMESIIYLKPGMSLQHIPVIVIPGNIDNTGLQAARLLQSALQQKIDEHSTPNTKIVVPILKYIDKSRIDTSSLVFSIGMTDIYKNYLDKIPVKEIEHYPQGYFIYTPNDRTNLVILGSGTGAGLYYAALTATQMLDGKSPLFHNARIVDYPDFPNRLFAIDGDYDTEEIRSQFAFSEQLIQYKLNGAILLKTSADHSPLKEEVYIPDRLNGLFAVYKAEGYIKPEDSTLSYKYPQVFSELNATANFPMFRFPLVYNNQMLDRSDFSECCMAKNGAAKSIYSGSSYFSINTDEIDINRYTAFFGSFPVFMDNSMRMSTSWGRYNGNDGFFPGKIRLFNIFEPFANDEIRNCFSLLDSSYFIINLPLNSEIEIIRLATAADFLWNASGYSKDYSLWKVLQSRYGTENARYLIEYAEKYGLILETVARLEINNQTARNIRTGQQYIAELTAILAKISDNLGVHNQLVKDLQVINAQLRAKLKNKL